MRSSEHDIAVCVQVQAAPFPGHSHDRGEDQRRRAAYWGEFAGALVLCKASIVAFRLARLSQEIERHHSLPGEVRILPNDEINQPEWARITEWQAWPP
jgi:hypothetical protein